MSDLALSSSAAAPRAAVDPNRASVTVWVSILAAMIGAFMAILNIQITNASLLNIEGGIGTGVDNGSWISTSYLIGEIVVIPRGVKFRVEIPNGPARGYLCENYGGAFTLPERDRKSVV